MKNIPIYISLLILLTCAKEDSQDPRTTPSNTTTKYTLTASAGVGGSVSPSAGSFNSGTQVSIKATPSSGYTFSGWSNGSIENPIILTITSDTSIEANFSLEPLLIGNQDLNIRLDITNVKEMYDDNQIIIDYEILDDGRIKLFAEKKQNEYFTQEKIKFIKWKGDDDFYENPLIIEADGRTLKLIMDDMYSYLNDNFDLPFIYDFRKQLDITENKPMGWEGKMIDYNGNGKPNLFTTVSTSSGSLTRITEYDNQSDSYSIIKDIDFSEYFPYTLEVDSITAQSGIYGDFNNDNKLDFFANFHGEFQGEIFNVNTIFKSGPMAALISNQDGDFDAVIVDEDEYLRFPGSCKTVDWNNDNNLDVFCSLPYNLYLNTGQGSFEKLNLDSIDPVLDWLSIRFSDINNDGYTDIVGANFNMQGAWGFGMEIYYGTSKENKFIYKTVYHPYYNGYWNGSDDLTIVDIDGDGIKEILTFNMIELNSEFNQTHDLSETMEFKYNGDNYYLNTDSNYNHFHKTSGGASANATTAWDFDNDGDLDIFIQSFTGKVPEMINDVGIGWSNLAYKEHHINTTYLFDLPFESDIFNGNFVPSGYFWENIDGVLVKKYFTELYKD